jgi:hypothetical protein
MIAATPQGKTKSAEKIAQNKTARRVILAF